VVTDPTRALEWMIGLPDTALLGAEDGADGEARIHVETKPSLVGCPSCGVLARVKDRSAVELVDLPLFERATRLVWHKRRWTCPDHDCAMGSWTEEDDRIAGSRQVLTSRAARRATIQVGRRARRVNEVASDLGCDWHTVNDTVIA
jgi:transposase